MAVSQSLAVDQIGQSIEGNYSTVRIRWTSTQTGSSRNGFTRTAYYYISINGGAEQEYTVSYTLPANTTQVILDTTITVPHNADGTGTVAVRTWMDTDISAGVVRTNKTVNLSTIPRATTAEVGAMTMGKAGTISLGPASSSFRHTLVYYFGEATGTIASKTAATSVSWTPPKTLAEQIPNSAAGVGAIHCITYSGDTKIGETSTPVTVSISDDSVPTISVALGDPTKVADTYGGYIQLRSRLRIAVTAGGVYGSSIKAYSVKAGDIYTGSSANNTTDYLPSAGTLAVSCTVTDSRGRTATWAQNITVIAYARPQVSAISAARCNADGTANWSGEYGKVTFSAAITPLDGENTARYTVQYREHGAADWLTAAITEEGDFSPADVSVVFAAAKSTRYEVRVLATDHWEGVGSTIRDLPAAFALLHNCKSRLSVGIGRLCDKLSALQVALDAFFDRDVTIDGALTTGQRVWIGGNKASDTEKVVRVQSTDGADHPHDVQIYGGNGASEVALGVYDAQAKRSVLKYDDVAGSLSLLGKTLLDWMYPIGAIYISTAATDPGTLFGGTWERIKDRFLLAAGDTYAAGKTGGESEVTLSRYQLPGAVWASGSGENAIVTSTSGAAGSGYGMYTQADDWGQAHNNMPPYLAVYVWRRTA